MIEKIDAFDELRTQVKAGGAAGVVALIADGEKVLDVQAIGHADLASGRVMQENTLFWIASVSKPITAALLMMFVDESKVALDDPLEKYMPAFAGQLQINAAARQEELVTPAKTSITIRHAMSHTSGLPFFSRVEKTIDRYPLVEAAMSYATSTRLFAPGSKYQYGNAGINSVGRILEIVSGKSFAVLLNERLLQPLGMMDTTFFPSTEQLARLATAYKPNETKTELLPTATDQLCYPLRDPHRHPSPAGGLFSTAHDVARFGQMVLNGGLFNGQRLLSEHAVATMTSTQTGVLNPHHGPGSGYGIGWETFANSEADPTGRCDNRCGHGGALSNHLDINRQTGRVSVFMVQQQGWPTPMAEKMRERFNEIAGGVSAKVER